MEVVRFAILGMATGSLVALVALGVVLTYRASAVLNFSVGAVGAFGAFLCYTLRDDHGVNWQIAVLAGVLAGAGLGALTQVLVIAMLRRTSTLGKLIASLGMMVFIQALIEIVWVTDSEFGRGQPSSVLPTEPIRFTDDLAIGRDRLIIVGFAVAVAVALRFVYSKTLFGLATSAVAEDRQVAALGGWSGNRIERVNFTLAGALAAIAAIFVAPIVGLEAVALTLLVIPAVAAALAGRFSSFSVTVAAALAIGAAQAELSRYQPEIADALSVSEGSLGGLPAAVPMLVIIVVSVWSGRGRLSRGDVASRLPLPGSGRVAPIPLAVGVCLALLVLFGLPASWGDALILTFVTGILVLSVVVVTGYAGQLSLAQFALAGFGAWVAARASDRLGMPFELALLLAIVTTIPVGLLVAVPAMRTRGVNLAVATLGFALMLQALIFNNASLTGGFVGTVVEPPRFLGIALDPIGRPERYGTFVLVLFVLLGLMVANVRRGRAGRRLLAVRSNERAAASLGVGIYGAKLYAFGLGAAIASVSGVLYAFRRDNVLFQDFSVIGSVTAVQYAVIGGIGWAAGAVIGASMAAGALLEEVLHTFIDVEAKYLVALGGLGAIVTLKRGPNGLAEQLSKLARARRARSLPGARPARPARPAEPRRDRRPATIEVRDVTVRFGGITAVQNVTFTVHPGEVVGLIGPNGAGKTTLLDAMTGFTQPDSGSIVLDGRPIDRWSPERRSRAGLGRSWQAVELFDEMTVYDNLLVAADRQRAFRYLTDLVRPSVQAPTEVVSEVVSELGLGDVLDLRPPALSQGKTRLVGIARAICTEPSVLLLDEPAAGLDTRESRELGDEIRRIAEQRGIGILVVEHDVPLLMTTCDRLVVLDFGRQIAAGTPAEVQSDPAVIKAYLGEDGPEDASAGREHVVADVVGRQG